MAAPVPRRAVLHIGTEKTGTTSLQHALVASLGILSDHGEHYPILAGSSLHASLVYHAADGDEEVADLRAMLNRPPGEDRATFGRLLATELAAECSDHPDERFLFSTEHAHSRLVSHESVARVRTLLRPFFDIIEIVVYLRRWDRVAVSCHATDIRNGAEADFAFERFLGTTYLDYAALLARWADVFGEDRLTVAIYARDALAGGSIVVDFAERLGLPPLAAAAERNATMPAAAQALLQRLNTKLRAIDPIAAADIRAGTLAGLEQLDGGPSARPPRADAIAFVRSFDDQAERIRARFFPDRAALFDEDFDEYPVAGHAVKASADDALDLLIAVVTARLERLRRTEAELNYYRARAHLEAGRFALARAEIADAILRVPGRANLHHLLGLIERAAGRPAAARQAAQAAVALEPDIVDHRNLLRSLDS